MATRRKRPAGSDLLGFGFALAVMAAGVGAGHAEPSTLIVGDQLAGARAVMAAAGVLDGTDYRVEWKIFPAAAPLVEALNADAIDVGIVGDAPFIFAFAAGAPIKAVAALRYDGTAIAMMVPAASPIHTAKDLKGRRIGTGRGSVGHYLALKLLAEAGLGAGDVTFAFLSPSDARAALATGSIDAWSAWGQYVAIAELEDGDRVLGSGHGLMSGLSYEVATVHATQAKHGELVDFLRRLAEARRWALTHRAAYAEAWAQDAKVSVAVANRTLEAQLPVAVPIDDSVVADQQATADFYLAAGVIPKPVDVAPGFDRSFNVSVSAAD